MKSCMTFEELCTEVARQQREKADYAVDTKNIQLEAFGNSIAMHLLDDSGTDVVEPLDVKQLAHRQIGTQLSIPAKYYDRLLDDHPELLAQNVNTLFRKEPAQRMLRTMSGQARAWLSNRYRRCDHLDILHATLPIIGEIEGVQFQSCAITESRMYIKAVNPRLQTEIAPGDVVQAGIVISNSEVGLGAVCIQPLIFRLVCRNGMIVNDAKTRRNHVGRVAETEESIMLYSDATLAADDTAFLMKIQDTVRAVVDEARFSMVVDKMREGREARMNTQDVPGIVKLASKDYGLSEAEGEGVLNHLIESSDLTLFGLANAVTRFSQDVTDYDRCTDLEGIGYSVLSMPSQQWTRYNQLSLPAAA